jgi:hypothetical protein
MKCHLAAEITTPLFLPSTHIALNYIMNCPQSTIGLLYTPDEWHVLEQAAHREGSDFRGYLHRRVSKLGKWAEGREMELSEIERLQRKFQTPEGAACQLNAMCRHFNIPLATLVTRFIIAPILSEHYEHNGILLPRLPSP